MKKDQGQLQILDEEIGPDDVMPGRLSDPYFFAALINILEKPSIVSNMFVQKQINDRGAYAINLTKNG